MKVCVIGSGYVGLVAGAGFAEIGHEVMCVDIDGNKIEALKRGELPIYEPGLDKICVKNQAEGRLIFSTDVPAGINFAEVVLIAVGTPEKEDGAADLSAVLAVARTIGENISGFCVVACKSTVPVGTNAQVTDEIKKVTQVPFAVVSNPEFLREGAALNDFMHPPRVVIGTNDARAEKKMRELYAPLYGYYDANDRIICMDPRSAEMTKYAANAFLATRITFINEIANLCELVGADVTKVRLGVGTDPRVGLKYFLPGCGYGGSCFPKDVQALLRTAGENDYRMNVLLAVDRTNDTQKLVPFEKLKRHFGGEFKGKSVAIWGLAFKSETDDIRESPAIYIVDALLKAGASVRCHDPIAAGNFARLVTDEPEFFSDKYAAVEGSDALILVSDWEEYCEADLNVVAGKMSGSLIVDGRNIWSSTEIPEGLVYEGVGLGAVKGPA